MSLVNKILVHRSFFLYFIPILIIAGTGILYIGLPGSPDQLELDYIAWLVLDGGTPYVDFIDNNWPGGYMLHMISTALFGVNLHSWRVLDYLIMIIGLFCLYDLLRRTFSKAAAYWALILYPGLYTASFSFWFAGQRDATIANLFWIVIWSYWIGWHFKKPLCQIFAGLSLAVAILLKPTAIFFCPLLSLHSVWSIVILKDNTWKEAMAHIGIGLSACCIALILAFAFVLFQGTDFQHLIDSVWLFNLYSQSDPNADKSNIVLNAINTHLVSWHWISIGMIVSALWLFLSRDKKYVEIALLFASVWLAGWLSYLIQGRGFDYHLAIIYAGMLPFLFMGLGRLVKNLRPTKIKLHNSLSLLLIAIAIFGITKKCHNMFADTYAWQSGKLGTAEYYDKFKAGDGMTLGDVYRLLPVIEAVAPQEKSLLMIGTQSATNYLLERRQPTRFYYFPIFLEARAPEKLVERWNDTFRNEIRQIASPFALVHRSSLLEAPKSKNELTEGSISLLNDILNQKYEFIHKYNRVDLYRLR